MVKIAKITTQKKNKERYNIFLRDGEEEYYAFSVDEATIIRFLLRKDMELTQQQLDEILEYGELRRAYTMSIRFLSFRMRSEKEIATYLAGKEIDETYVKLALDRLREENLVDDQEFANMFTRTRIKTTTKGPGLVRRELFEKGLDRDVIEEALKYFTYEIQYERAHKVAEKRLRQRKQDSLNKKENQVRQTLYKEGFTAEVIKEVLEEVFSDQVEAEAAEEEEAALAYQAERLTRRLQRRYKGGQFKQKLREGLYTRGFRMDVIQAYMDKKEDES